MFFLWDVFSRRPTAASGADGCMCKSTANAAPLSDRPTSYYVFVLAGNMDNSFPNPALRKSLYRSLKENIASPDKVTNGNGWGDNDGGEPEYLPAYMLSDWSLEREGRGKRTIDTLACELR